MKLNLEFERDKVLTSFNRNGFKRGVSFAKVCDNIDVYSLLIQQVINSSGFAYKTKPQIELIKNTGKYIAKELYPKGVKIINKEVGFDLKSGTRIIEKNELKKSVRLCRKHQIEYPVGSKCPECNN